jgi:tripartite-type tricarboxylate transporter receptor subunit TctC
MIRSRKLRTSLVAVSALALVAAACGGGNDEPVDEAAPPEETDEPDEPEEGAEEAVDDADDAGVADDNPLAGEDITLTVGVGPGGGYDSYVRLMGPYLAEELGATVVINNEPGAGGLVALNNLLASDPDGTNIMLINGVGIAGSYLAEADGVNFELDELGYVGRVYAGSKLIGAGADTGYDTWDDVEGSSDPFVFGASGPGASTYVEPTVLMELLELPYEIVTGFDGSADIQTAMVAGEVDGISLDLDSLLPTVESGDANALLLMGPTDRVEELPDTPVLAELELTDEQAEMRDSLQALIEYGRTLVVHPDTDPELIDLLRTAIENVLTDAEFLEDAESQGRPIEFASGDEVEGQVDTILQAPDAFVEIIKLGY